MTLPEGNELAPEPDDLRRADDGRGDQPPPPVVDNRSFLRRWADRISDVFAWLPFP